ncbi:MAG: hypothetical protein BGP12_21115 [Rhodospirillales bacterium 70-18]|nr:MAG: hypothetical protein BGP12_21115 [Rhodospirillales bacterium 70-18]
MEYFVLLLLALMAGWVLGIIGFFKARRALAEVAALRRAMAVPMAVPMAEVRAEVAAPVSPWAAAAPAELAPPAAAAMEDAPGATVEPPAPPPPRDLEALLTQRWGVWLGAAALLLSGVFLVRYAAEQGMLGPAVRCALAGLLGVALVASAEWLRRRPAGEAPALAALGADQAPPALAAGGVAVLFGAAYGAGPLYDLVPPLVGFALMAAAALAGMALSLRHGVLVAAVGVAGAYVTPALVTATAPYAPGLFGYLLVVSAAALMVVRHAAWAWLGWAATLAGALWVALAASGGLGTEYWAPGLFVPAAAALHLALLPAAALDHKVGRRLSWVPFAALGAAGLLLEATVPDAAVRAGLLLLSPLAVWRGATEPRLDRLPWLAALLFLLALLAWALPEWQPTGEVIATEGFVQAVLPGAWAPEAIQPLLITAALMAAFHALAGLWLERRMARPLAWSALVAGVPVAALAVTYAQVALFQPDILWAFAALALTAGLTGTAYLAGDKRRAGVHAAGAVAALALGCAVLLDDHWLTLAVSLFLPALAWIEARADLPPLRHVALAVASVVLVRLLLNWYVLDYGFGAAPVLNGLIPAYGVPAAAFALAGWMFRRRADDRTVAVLEAGALAFATVLVALEIRHWATHDDLTAPGGFTEAALHVAALAVQGFGVLHLARRSGRAVQGWAWRLQGGAALLGGVLLLLANPVITDDATGQAGLLAGYLLPAALAGLAARAPELAARRWPLLLGGYAVLAGFVWVGLEVRLLYHPGALGLDAAPIDDAELWAWSGGWLAYGGVLMALGMATRLRALRLAALAIIGLVAAKAFLIDMAGLEGLWRVLSFLGLGLALIGLGAAYRRFVAGTQAPEHAETG